MSEKQRKSFTAQFKAKVALEAIRGQKTLNEIGREFGIHFTLQCVLWNSDVLLLFSGYVFADALFDYGSCTCI